MTDDVLLEILGASEDVAYDWDLHSDTLTWYGDWKSLFPDLSKAPLDSQSFYKLLHPDDRATVFGHEGTSYDRQYRLLRGEKSVILVHERGSILSHDGRLVRQRGIIRRINKNPEVHMGTDSKGYDSLTGCLDRGHMLESINRSIGKARSTQKLCAYIVLGIDKMSFVNEAVGMEAGDVLLRSTAQRIAELLPLHSTLARVGGDMFGILLFDCAPEDSTLIAEKILRSFRDHPVVTSVTPLHITVSIGGVSIPEVAKNASEAMIFAEQALHDARQRGRNLFIEYLDSPERAQENREFLNLAESIKQAFKTNGFRLAYQPIVDAATAEVVCYEALVRMFDGAGKPIAAAHFVPAIEKLGLAFELDKKVLDLAIQDLEDNPQLCLAVNISGLTAAQTSWAQQVQTVLGLKTNVARRLIFEITETAAIVDVAETRHFVDQVRQLGGRVALDDFGAGFTSIRHLRTLAISIMKIDKELLDNLVGNAEQQHLVRILIELAHGLGIKTIAEGVETKLIADWLCQEKVDMLQGYYFGKPSLDKPGMESKAALSSAHERKIVTDPVS